MRRTARAVMLLTLTGCAAPDGGPVLRPVPAPAPSAAFATPFTRRSQPGEVVRPAAGQQPSLGWPQLGTAELSEPVNVDDFVRLAIERNPRLARATFAIEAARGRHLQAGLYPNPELAVNWDEIGDRSSPDRLGILTVPLITQTIVTGRKLTLAQAVAAQEINQATLNLLAERYAVIGSVRASFYESLVLQARAEILTELVKLADEAVATGKALLDAKQIARLDYLQLEVERERFRAELFTAQKELPASYRRLAAITGTPGAIPQRITGTLDNLPTYDADRVREAVLTFHPQVRAAQVAVARAQAAVHRAEVEPIPNVTVYTGYIRQFQNRSHDGAVGVSLPLPLWNRNQGNILASRAELGMAIQAVAVAENELAARVAAAIQTYAPARARADMYRTEVLPRAEETYKLSLAAFKGGQFEYLRVIQAQRAIAEARLEYNRALGEAWRAAAELSGLLLEEVWPPPTGK